jgi:hypothetical protein
MTIKGENNEEMTTILKTKGWKRMTGTRKILLFHGRAEHFLFFIFFGVGDGDGFGLMYKPLKTSLQTRCQKLAKTEENISTTDTFISNFK